MSRLLALLMLAGWAHSAWSAPVPPQVPCDRPVFVFGAGTAAGKGVAVSAYAFPQRMKTFFSRVCRRPVTFEVGALENVTFSDSLSKVLTALDRSPRAIVLVHFPLTDVEAGESVESLLAGYRKLIDACARARAVCVIGGQQPVNVLSREQTDRQLELEQRASADLGPNFLPLYRYLRSESTDRHLMRPLDSGDGRYVHDVGHELLFKLYRNRLLELTRPK